MADSTRASSADLSAAKLSDGDRMFAGEAASGDTSGNKVKDQVVKERFRGVVQRLGFAPTFYGGAKPWAMRISLSRDSRGVYTLTPVRNMASFDRGGDAKFPPLREGGQRSEVRGQRSEGRGQRE